MRLHEHRIVVCGGARTPIGHISRSLAGIPAPDLITACLNSAVEKAGVSKEQVDGVFVGWVGQDFTAPNIARVAMLRAGMRESAPAVTHHSNCLSSIETVTTAVQRILAGAGELFLAGGVESMSRLPYTITGSRAAKELRSLDTVKARWGELLTSAEVQVVDSMERGLTDPVKDINMAATAEVCAQMHGVSRDAQDEFAHSSFKRCVAAWNRGFYSSHVVPFAKDGAVVLEKDEYPFLREDLIAKPIKFSKAPLLFENSAYSMADFYRDYGKHMGGKTYQEGAHGTVTLFNSCGRSDGASVAVVATERKAKALGLPILAEIKGFAFVGNDPAHMGVSPALAAPAALEHAGIGFDELGQIELHEPFAATVLGIFKLGAERFGHDWAGKLRSGALNPNGGSIAMGHPLGATGCRLILNLVYAMKENPEARYGMAAACAGGGIGGALVLQKYA
jgi:acetyl-CoA C-acetyltransferase